MALTWITEVANHTNYTIFLKQTDPTRNPVIDEVRRGAGWCQESVAATLSTANLPLPFSSQSGNPTPHEWFAVAPKTTLKTSRFIVPWANTEAWVYLVINKEQKPVAQIDFEESGVQFQIVPDGGGAHDFLQFCNRDMSPVMGKEGSLMPPGEFARIPVGPAGAAASTSGRLNMTDAAVTYDITESNSAGADALAVVRGMGEVVLDIAAVVVAVG